MWKMMMIFFFFFKILIFQVVSGVQVQEMVQNMNKFSVMLHISGTRHHTIFIYGAHM